jgi:hypothetical protein
MQPAHTNVGARQSRIDLAAGSAPIILGGRKRAEDSYLPMGRPQHADRSLPQLVDRVRRGRGGARRARRCAWRDLSAETSAGHPWECCWV